MKKLLCLFLSLALLLGLFAGCGEKSISSPTDVVVESVVPPWEKEAESTEDTATVVSKAEESKPSASQLPTSSIPLAVPPSDGSSGEEIITIPISPVSPLPPSSATTSKEEPKPIAITFRSIYKEQYTGETGMGKLWKDHFGKMAEKGILTSFSEIDPDTAVDTIFREVLAGKATTDVYEVSLGLSHQLAVKKVLANVFDSKTLNQKAFDNGGTHSNTINGKTYGASLSANANVMMILYNKDLIKRYAPHMDIPTLVAKNQWNYETFRTLAKKCTVDINGDGKNDRFGIVAGTDFITGFLYAATGGYAVMGKEKIEFAVVGEKAEVTLSFGKSLFKNDKAWKYYANSEKCAEYFAQGYCGMFAIPSWNIVDITQRLPFEFGLAPFPVPKEKQEKVYGVMDTKVFVVPLTAKSELDDVGVWLNGVAKIDSSLASQVTFQWDRENALMYQTILRGTTAEYSAGATTTMIMSQVHSFVTAACRCTLESKIRSITAVGQHELDEFYAPLYEE